MRLKKDKSGDTVGRVSRRSSLPGDPGANFFCGKPQHMKNSLNFANTCLKVIDTRRMGHRGRTGRRWHRRCNRIAFVFSWRNSLTTSMAEFSAPPSKQPTIEQTESLALQLDFL